jgi:hypothetical protein
MTHYLGSTAFSGLIAAQFVAVTFARRYSHPMGLPQQRAQPAHPRDRARRPDVACDGQEIVACSPSCQRMCR